MLMNTETVVEQITAIALDDAPVVPVSIQYWANEINAATEEENKSINHKGLVLIAAKKALLRHGLWEKLFKKNKRDAVAPVRFSVKTALKYMKIAKNATLSNSNLNYCLPPDVTVQYQLTFIPDSLLTDYIAAGFITPELSVEDAKKLRSAKSPDGIVVRSDGSLGLAGEHSSEGPYATLAAYEAITRVNFPVLRGRTYRLCGKHRLMIASIVEPSHAWAALLDGTCAFVPWPSILVADHFGPNATPVLFVLNDEQIAATILSLYRHRYGAQAIELLCEEAGSSDVNGEHEAVVSCV